MENKTAVTQLIEDLKSVGIKFNPDKYLELEKKQIMFAYLHGQDSMDDNPSQSAVDFFNKKYNTNANIAK